MYVDYNMGEVLLMACAFSSLVSSVGGGVYFFLQEKEKELITEKQALPYVTAYMECDFKGDNHAKFGDAPDFEKAEISLGIPLKSIIVPDGYQVDMYSQEGYKGSKLSRRGPFDQKCTTIHSMIITKE
jgi:hypothetical protein